MDPLLWTIENIQQGLKPEKQSKFDKAPMHQMETLNKKHLKVYI